MPITLPNLDDRRFDDLVKEVRALVPRYAPAWTDHNASDPGITLIELFAWVTEALFYRANRAHEASEARLLELMGAAFQPARPATVSLTVKARGLEEGIVIPRDTLLTATPPDGSPVKFETISDLKLGAVPGQSGLHQGSVQARQVVRVKDESLGLSDGRPFQRIPLATPFVVIDEEALFPLLPEVKVNGDTWTYKRNLFASAPDSKHFTVDPRTSEIYFGNGHQDGATTQKGLGWIPPLGADITASYRSTRGLQGNVPRDATFAFDEDLGIDVEIERDGGVQNSAAAGADPTSLDAARAQALDALRKPFRAVTAADFERIVIAEPDFYLARAKCLPGLDLSADGEETLAADHVSVIIVPKASSVEAAAFSPDGRRIVTASSEHTARVWDVAGGHERRVLTGHTGSVQSASYSPDGMRVVTASDDGTARVWDASSADEVQALVGHAALVWSAAYSPDGTRIVTASEDGTARVWDATSGEEVQALVGHAESVRSAAYSPDGTRIVTASEDGTARVWDASSGDELLALVGPAASVWSAVYSPDSARIVTAMEDGVARVWEVASGKLLHVLGGHLVSVWSARYSPDGTRIVTASEDGTARVWNAFTGLGLLVLSGHAASVWSAAFSPKATRIVTASKDGTARIWDATSGDMLHELSARQQHPRPGRRDIDDVCDFLDQRRLITCHHHVVGPRYTDLWVEARVIAGARVPGADVEEAVESALVGFFDPLSGGPGADGGGWPFGRDIHASEVYQLIEGVDGVDHVARLLLKTTDKKGNEVAVSDRVEIAERHLVHFHPHRSVIEVRGPA